MAVTDILRKLAQLKEKFCNLVHLRTFVLSLGLMLLSLIAAIFIAPWVVGGTDHNASTQLTGKIMATVDMPVQPVEEPIKETVKEHTEEIPPEPTTPTTTPTPESNLHDPVPPSPPTNPPPILDEDSQKDMELEDSLAGLTEATAFGPLPIIRQSDGMTSYKAYAQPFHLKADTRAIISVVIVDYGLSETLSSKILSELPPHTSFVASPYAHNLQHQTTTARSKGFEVWLDLPLQGTSPSTHIVKNHLGPHTLLAGLNLQENMNRLNMHLGRVTGYVGVASTVKPTFGETSPDLQVIVDSLVSRGLGVVQLESTDRAIIKAAASAKAMHTQSHIWVDDGLMDDDVNKLLQQATETALKNGQAVVVFEPSLKVPARIKKWQDDLKDKNIELAPLSYATRMNMSAPALSSTLQHPSQSQEPDHAP